MSKHITSLFFLTFSLSVSSAGTATATAPASSSLPQAARITIAQLRDAAAIKDFAKLRSLMTGEFIWSFGGDANADQAIAAWRDDSSYLQGLRATLDQGCQLSTHDEIECPGKGGGDFRAGLVKTPAGWRLHYLVAGD